MSGSLGHELPVPTHPVRTSTHVAAGVSLLAMLCLASPLCAAGSGRPGDAGPSSTIARAAAAVAQDPPTGRIVLPLRTKLTNIVADPVRPYIYVGRRADAEILVVSVTDGTVVRTIPVGLEPQALDISRDGALLYIAAGGNQRLDIVDLGSQTLARSVALSHAPYRVAAGRAGRVYVAGSFPNGIMIVDVERGIELSYHLLPRDIISAFSLTVSRDGSALYAMSHGSPSGAGRFDISSDQLYPIWVSQVGSGGGYSSELALSADGSRLYIANGIPSVVRVFDTRDCTEVGQLDTGGIPNALELDPLEQIAFTSNSTSAVTIFEVATRTRRNAFSLQLGELERVRDITIAPDRRRLYLVAGNVYDTVQDLWIVMPELDDSRKLVRPDTAMPGQRVSVTMAITNTTIDAVEPVIVTDHLPPSLRLVAGSLTGGASYDSSSHTVTWTGTPAGGTAARPSFAANVLVRPVRTTVITNTMSISMPLWSHPIVRSAAFTIPAAAFLPYVRRVSR